MDRIDIIEYLLDKMCKNEVIHLRYELHSNNYRLTEVECNLIESTLQIENLAETQKGMNWYITPHGETISKYGYRRYLEDIEIAKTKKKEMEQVEFDLAISNIEANKLNLKNSLVNHRNFIINIIIAIINMVGIILNVIILAKS